jgi:hypothetical protein
MALAGCNGPVERSKGEEAREDGGWTASPQIRAVERQGSGLVVRGDAPPGARVVLRGGQDVAFAAGTDAAGRFELRVGELPSAMLLMPEVQVGQFPASGPEKLLLAGEGDLAALLVEGGPSRRLSAGPALASVDGDGRGLVVAGRAKSGTQVAVSADGGPAIEAVADSTGRWTAVLPNVGDRPVTIEVGGASFAYPGPTGATGVGLIERSGSGWRLTRALSPSSRQTSWFPDL